MSSDLPAATDGGEHVVICGGGVAGLSAAVRLAQAGVKVTLVEQRQRLGGRASSVNDPKSDSVIDNCQHVVMRACTALLDLYGRLGVADQIQWSTTLHFADPEDPTAVYALKPDDLPAPMHLLRPMMKFGLLSASQKFSVARAMLAVMQVGSSHRARSHYNNQSFREWLDGQNQSADVVELFWSPIIVSACNEWPEHVAAGYAFQVLQDGLLAADDAYELGLALCPLADLYDPAAKLIEDAGGTVHLGTTATGFAYADGAVTGLQLNTGETITGDHYVAAVPFDRLGGLLPDDLKNADERFGQLDALQVSPILGIHLYYRTTNGRPVMEMPHVVLPERPVHWLFNKGAVDLPEHGQVQHVHAVISAAHDLVDESADDLAVMADAEVHRLFGTAHPELQRVHQRVIKEKHATFSIRPGIDAARPAVSGATANLLLAGDWTDTGWPATMEGAARSGYAAAAAVLGEADAITDSNRSLLYRLIAS